jgi:hypothetical protein
MNPEELKQHNEKLLRRSELAEVEPITTVEALTVEIKKWLILEDELVMRFLCGFIFAHKLSKKAVWAILIGPSGGGKTELINAFMQLPEMVAISSLTPNTFLSGMPGPHDASLLPKLSDKVMVFKDWTTMISMQKDAKADIFSQFREIHDGDFTKIFGNGKQRKWHGRVSLLAASTQAIDITQQQNTYLGERFINYRVTMPDRKEVALRSLNNNKDQDRMGKELQNAVFAFFKSFEGKDIQQYADVDIDDEFKREIVDLSNFATMARSAVIRDTGMRKEVIFVPATEMPTRFTQQLSSLAMGLMAMNNGKLAMDDKRVVYKVTLDSVPITNKMLIDELARWDYQSTTELAVSVGYPTETVRVYLENMALLGVCKRSKHKGSPDRWKLREDFAALIRKYEGIETLTEEEVQQRREDAEAEHGNGDDDGWDQVNEDKVF